MFNNIIYFIVALLIFNINYPGDTPANSLPLTLIMLLPVSYTHLTLPTN